MMKLFWVCVGGGAGSGLRYLFGLWASRSLGTALPWGTLGVNLIGCFLMAFLVELAGALALPPNLRLALTTGFLGGLTTYSAFNQESSSYVHAGSPKLAMLYVALTVVGCFVAGLLGWLLAKRSFAS